VATRISVFSSAELQALIVAMRGLDSAVAKQVRRVTKGIIEPVWKSEIASRVRGVFQTRVLSDTARVAVSNQNVTLKSAHIGRSLSGGRKPSELMHAAEFGADRSHTKTYGAKSRKGTRFTVNDRHTRNQFKSRKKTGYVVYQAVAEVIPRIASLWVQTYVRTTHEEIEKVTHG
jgi:hypothetical protein